MALRSAVSRVSRVVRPAGVARHATGSPAWSRALFARRSRARGTMEGTPQSPDADRIASYRPRLGWAADTQQRSLAVREPGRVRATGGFAWRGIGFVTERPGGGAGGTVFRRRATGEYRRGNRRL